MDFNGKIALNCFILRCILYGSNSWHNVADKPTGSLKSYHIQSLIALTGQWRYRVARIVQKMKTKDCTMVSGHFSDLFGFPTTVCFCWENNLPKYFILIAIFFSQNRYAR